MTSIVLHLGWNVHPQITLSDIMDDEGHGTHVAGIIAAGGNNGKGVTGLNWNVKIMGCKACIEDMCLLTAIIECYNYIGLMKDKGVNVKAVNLSLGQSNYSQAEYDALNNLRNKGILVVAAAGNEGQNNDYHPYYPCNYALDNIICVGSTDAWDNLSWFSNYGNSVHIAAPGDGILSTYIDDYFEFTGFSKETIFLTILKMEFPIGSLIYRSQALLIVNTTVLLTP